MARNKRWSASSKSSSDDKTSGLGGWEQQPMIEIIEGLPKKVVGIAVKGRVTMEDCRDVLMPAMKKSLKRHEKIRLYYELSCRVPGGTISTSASTTPRGANGSRSSPMSPGLG